MKQDVLIVYSKMIVGGSTTSLLSLLNEFDYARYNVDLLLLEKGGALDSHIPSAVRVLDNSFLRVSKKSISYVWAFAKALLVSQLKGNRLIRSQIMPPKLVEGQPKLEKSYDTAIAYLEFWPSCYVHRNVSAKKKLLWLHCDYKGAGLEPAYDKAMYEKAYAVVTVSEACQKNLEALFPTLRNVVCIHNILSAKTIRSLAETPVGILKAPKADIAFVTVARIDFQSKGHDRGVAVFEKMKAQCPDKSFRWLIIGDGPNRGELEKQIADAGLQNEIILLGECTNPHPYVRQADIFFLPSRYEGKPMAVTEAQMNGVVPFVTNYASAHGQIRHMHDGLICENSDDALFDMMSRIFSGEINIGALKENVQQNDYSNHEEMEHIYNLISR